MIAQAPPRLLQLKVQLRDVHPAVWRRFTFGDHLSIADLVDTLRRQGMQPQQQVIFMSDGAETPRRLQLNIAPEAEHVLDWFHVTMRLTVLGQMLKGAWTDAAEVKTKAAELERIKWRLWHSPDEQTLVADLTRTPGLRHRVSVVYVP